MKKNNIISISLFTFMFLIIGMMVRNASEGILFDKIILDLIHKGENPILLSIMKLVSFVGSAYFLIPLMLVLVGYTLYRKKYYILKLLTVSTLGSYMLNIVLKFIFNRTRPLDYFLVDQAGLSYPSGHSMVTMTFYMTLAYLFTENIKNIKKKKYIYGFAWLMILLMGISRLYLGVHWPTDVIGGYLIGYVFFITSRNLIRNNK